MNSNQLFSKNVRKLRLFALTLFFALLATNSFGQTKVSGVVSDMEKDEPLVGVVVNVQGTKIHTLTDLDGKFTINAKPDDVLEFSFLGMRKQMVVVPQSKYVSLKMEQESVLIDNVVVTGFQTLSKERATGSFAKVNSVDLEKYNTTSITDKLSSTINGVYVNTNGDMEIRGRSTLNISDDYKSSPLLVVDGFPIEGGLGSINPDEIESITVLRDAAAASIYGIKSANGVVVVTRKRPEQVKLNIVGTASYTISQNPSLSSIKKMNAAEAVDYQWEALDKGLLSTILNQNSGIYSELGAAYLLYQAGDINGANAIKNRLASYGDLARKQYEDELFRTSQVGQYGIMLSGRSDRAEYSVSGRIEDTKSLYKGNKSTKYFLNTQLALDITKRLTFKVATSHSYTNNTSNAPTGINTYERSMIPFEPLIVDGSFNALSSYGSSHSISYKYRDLAKQIGLLENGIEYNPIKELRYSDNTSNTSYNRYQFGLDYKFDFGLNLNVKYQYEDSRGDGKYLYSPQTYSGANNINQYAQYDGTSVIYNLDRDKSRLSKSTSDQKTHLIRGTATFDRALGERHYLSALAGIELQKITNDSDYSLFANYDKVTGFILPSFVNTSNQIRNWANEQVSVLSSNFANYTNSTKFQRYFSFFFNAGYTYNKKYNLTASFRIDQSNIFGTDSKYRYKPMWSVGASWNINKEDFMKDITWINNLTLRATYGLTGMIDKSTSPYIIIEKSKDDVVGEYASFLSAPNPNLRWEQTQNLNIGVDYSLFKNRIGGYVEYYRKYTTDVIAPDENDPTNGFETITANTAEISNRGFDINVHSLNFDGDFKWATSFNFSTNHNKVEKLYSNVGLNASYYVTGSYNGSHYLQGGAVDELYSYKWAGLNDQGYAQVYDKDGNIIVGDVASNLKSEDLVAEGRTEPAYFGNMTNTFSWNNFTLAINITYKLGYKTRAYTYRDGYTDRFQKIMAQRWINAGDELTTNVPALHNGTDNSYLYATYGTQNTINASHIRLKYISLSYSLPKTIIKKWNINDITFSLQAENLGILWRANDIKLDPDTQAINGERISIPALTTYTLGVNIKF